MIFLYYFWDSSIEVRFGFWVAISKNGIPTTYKWNEIKFSKLKNCQSIWDFNKQFQERLEISRAKWKKEKKKESFQKVLDEVMGFSVLKKKK